MNAPAGRTVRLVVLDMVGTTVRAGDEIPRAFRAALGAAGVTVSDEDLAAVRGRSKRDAIEDLLRRSGAEPGRVDAAYAGFQEELRGAYRECAEEIPGAATVLRGLSSRVAVVLNTGLDRDTARVLADVLGWHELGLIGVVTGDDVERGRPAPDLIEAAMRLAGVTDPQEVAVVGDTESDLAAGAAAGVGWSVAVLTGAHDRSRLAACQNSVILDSITDLTAWLEGEGVLSAPRDERCP